MTEDVRTGVEPTSFIERAAILAKPVVGFDNLDQKSVQVPNEEMLSP